MKNEPITNQNLMGIDFAKREKIAFIRAIRSGKPTRAAHLAPGLAARGIWMNDASAMDRRSVKAQLAGRGDHRVLWWRLNCAVHCALQPNATLEQMMCVFHMRHHRWTFAWLAVVRDFQEVYDAIQYRGIGAGLRVAVGQLQAPREP